MQEIRYDEPDKLTDDPSLSDFLEAAKSPKNRSVALHKPGAIIGHSDGNCYEVQADGSWRKVV